MCSVLLSETFDSEEDQLKHDLLHGGFNLNDLPNIPSNIVKLYVCASRKGMLIAMPEFCANVQKKTPLKAKPCSNEKNKQTRHSSLSEFEKERDILMKEVYPDLRRYCRDNYGVDFQVRL